MRQRYIDYLLSELAKVQAASSRNGKHDCVHDRMWLLIAELHSIGASCQI